MKERIRVAEITDAAAFVAIKDALPFKKVDGSTTNGGFLLGTNEETYKQYIKNAYCLVAEVDGVVVGFGIIFGDTILRNSEIWLRRNSAKWNIKLEEFESLHLCYFEQLAFLKGHRKLVLQLAYNLVKWVFDDGYEFLFTTTVKSPVVNLAAIPFIEAAGGEFAGSINEIYPEIGKILSDIYLIGKKDFYSNTREHILFPFFKSATLNFPAFQTIE